MDPPASSEPVPAVLLVATPTLPSPAHRREASGKGVCVGDVYSASEVAYYDRRTPIPESPASSKPVLAVSLVETPTLPSPAHGREASGKCACVGDVYLDSEFAYHDRRIPILEPPASSEPVLAVSLVGTPTLPSPAHEREASEPPASSEPVLAVSLVTTPTLPSPAHGREASGKGACVGDVYLASEVEYHDRRIPIPDPPASSEPVPQVSLVATPTLPSPAHRREGEASLMVERVGVHILDLPLDLTRCILLSVPRSSLHAVKLTCKDWNSELRAPLFGKEYNLRRIAENSSGISKKGTRRRHTI